MASTRWGNYCASYSLGDTLEVNVEPRAASGWIGTFFDRQATICSQSALPGTAIYVVAELSGTSGTGITGAEFRVWSSNPGAFFLSEELEPGWIKIGNVFGDGVTMAASTCATGPRAVLLKAFASPLGEPTDVHLFVDRNLSPTNPTYTEPMFILCDAPYYTAVVAGRGYAAWLNPSDGVSMPCSTAPTAVQDKTWTQVKGLYLDASK